MPVQLNIPTKPYWLDLPHGVKLHVRPCTVLITETARSAAVRVISDIRDGAEAVRDVGLMEKLGVDFTNPDQVDAVGRVTYAVAIARAAIMAWEGVVQADSDEPAPVNAGTVQHLMLIPSMADVFLDKYTRPIEQLVTEGNGSRPEQNGSSAAALNTAPDASG